MLESIKGFFVLGGRHLANKIRLFSLGLHHSKLDGEIKDRMRNVGRTSWEMGLAETYEMPSADKIRKYEVLLKEKKAALADVDSQIEAAEKKQDEHRSQYQNKLKDQVKLKQPVEEEYTDLQVEIKRMKKERRGTQAELKNLFNKLELQSKRKDDLGNSGLETARYLKSEIESEIGLNRRFLSLKQENLQLLDRNIEKCFQQLDKVKLVLAQYDESIAEIRSDMRDMMARDRDEISKLNDLRSAIEEQISKIKHEMSPVLEKLGGEITTRRVASNNLVAHYRKIDKLENKKERLEEKIDRLKRSNAEIGFGIKAGFYLLLASVAVGIGLVIYFASKGY